MVTTKVVEQCELIPHSVANVSGVHGSQPSNTYLVNVYLPNGVIIGGVNVAEVPALASEAGLVDDILIGMDIIGLGDFATSNYQGKRQFTFRMPSHGDIDFNPQTTGIAKSRTPKVGRNDPCPCGSGKKYKKCHGA